MQRIKIKTPAKKQDSEEDSTETVSDELEYYKELCEKLQKRIDELEAKPVVAHMKSVVREDYDLTEDVVRQYLEKNSVNGDSLLLNRIYKKKPVKFINRRRYEYYADEYWHTDVDGLYLRKILSGNLMNSYMKVNKFDHYKKDRDKFLRNQQHIMKLNDEAYQKRLVLNYALSQI